MRVLRTKVLKEEFCVEGCGRVLEEERLWVWRSRMFEEKESV